MIRTVTIASAFLLATTSIAHSGDRGASAPDIVLHQRNLLTFDMSMTPREYEKISGRNRKMVMNSLKSFSGNALESIGIPRQGINLVGATLGVVYNNGTRLNLNKSKTLALQIKNMMDSDRALFLGVNLGW